MKPVKRLMKADDQVTQKISRDANVVMTALLELFLRDLAARSAYQMVRNRRVCMTAGDVAAAAVDSDVFDFLIDILPSHELDAARTAAQEQCERAREDEDILYLALARQRRRTDDASLRGNSGHSHSQTQSQPAEDVAQDGLGTLASPAQILQQQHLQTLMSMSAQMGTSVVPVAHEYAAVAAAMSSMTASSFTAPQQQQQPQQQQDQDQLQPQAAATAASSAPGPVAAAAATPVPGTTGVMEARPQELLPFFTFQPADAGVEGLSTVAIAHEAAEAENMGGGMAVAPGVHTGAFPTLWMQNAQLREREELDDENEDDDDDDYDDYEEEEQDLYDPDEEEYSGDDDDDDNDDVNAGDDSRDGSSANGGGARSSETTSRPKS